VSAPGGARALGAPAEAARALASTSEEEAARDLAGRYGLEFVDVASFAPDPEILKSVPVELMFRYDFLPYRREGERLVLVVPGESPDRLVLEVSGDLHYAAAPAFLAEAEGLVPEGARLVVVDLSHAHETRLAALRVLEELSEHVAGRGGRLELCGVSETFLALIRRAGSRLPATPALPEPGASARECLRGARPPEPPRAT